MKKLRNRTDFLRDTRAKWMFDGILNEGSLTDDEYISVIGQTPPGSKKAKISEAADIVFLFQRCRFVFIFDLSASGGAYQSAIRAS